MLCCLQRFAVVRASLLNAVVRLKCDWAGALNVSWPQWKIGIGSSGWWGSEPKQVGTLRGRSV